MNILKVFDWTPVAVKAPRPRYTTYDSVSARLLIGYVVEIEYRYHGWRDVFFPSAYNEKSFDSNRRRALRKAIIFYKNAKHKISTDKQKGR